TQIHTLSLHDALPICTTFEQQYTAHPNINAVVTPNDDNANAIISYLKTLKVPPKTFPTTGQDATLTGLQNVLAGYQCGTVYKPRSEEHTSELQSRDNN